MVRLATLAVSPFYSPNRMGCPSLFPDKDARKASVVFYESDEHFCSSLHSRRFHLRALYICSAERRSDICPRFRVARLRRRQIQEQAGGGSQRACTDLRQQPGGTGLDCDPGTNCPGPLPGRRTRDCIGSESAATTGCAAGDRYRPPVLVGIPISWPEYRHCE